jgi:hypothetical protein
MISWEWAGGAVGYTRLLFGALSERTYRGTEAQPHETVSKLELVRGEKRYYSPF